MSTFSTLFSSVSWWTGDATKIWGISLKEFLMWWKKADNVAWFEVAVDAGIHKLIKSYKNIRVEIKNKV